MLTISHETEELARRLAIKIGKSPEDVITDAVQASARILGVTNQKTNDRDAVIATARAIVQDYQRLPVLDKRTPDEVLGYDEHGLPA